MNQAPHLRPSPHAENADVARAQQGDLAAFERLYRQHVGRVHALCRRLAGGAGVDELVQDVFVRVWEKLPTYRGESSLPSWIHRVAVNVFFASQREAARRESRVQFSDEPELLDAAVPLRNHGSDADDRMDLERALTLLPAGARSAFVLHEIEGYDHQEIADMQGIAAATVRVQVHRAKRMLMEALNR